MERADILPQIVATVTNIDGMDYRSIESDMTDDDKTLKPVGEGAVIPQTKNQDKRKPRKTSQAWQNACGII